MNNDLKTRGLMFQQTSTFLLLCKKSIIFSSGVAHGHARKIVVTSADANRYCHRDYMYLDHFQKLIRTSRLAEHGGRSRADFRLHRGCQGIRHHVGRGSNYQHSKASKVHIIRPIPSLIYCQVFLYESVTCSAHVERGSQNRLAIRCQVLIHECGLTVFRQEETSATYPAKL